MRRPLPDRARSLQQEGPNELMLGLAAQHGGGPHRNLAGAAPYSISAGGATRTLGAPRTLRAAGTTHTLDATHSPGATRAVGFGRPAATPPAIPDADHAALGPACAAPAILLFHSRDLAHEHLDPFAANLVSSRRTGGQRHRPSPGKGISIAPCYHDVAWHIAPCCLDTLDGSRRDGICQAYDRIRPLAARTLRKPLAQPGTIS